MPNNDDITLGEEDIVIWIARVISKADVVESLAEVVEQTLRPFTKGWRLEVYWRFYCFESEARALMEAGLENLHMNNLRTAVVFWPRNMKPYFWSRSLNPMVIPREVDYIWLLDGDISLRHLAWECFWTVSHDQLRPSIFHPALIFVDPERERSKTGWHQVVHPGKCEGDNPSPSMKGLVAIETGFVGNQLPVFCRDTWNIVYDNFNAKLGNWGTFATSWGEDISCIEQKNTSSTNLVPYMHRFHILLISPTKDMTWSGAESSSGN